MEFELKANEAPESEGRLEGGVGRGFKRGCLFGNPGQVMSNPARGRTGSSAGQ